jgi:hypothetical protein
MAGHIPDSLSVDWCTPDWICNALVELFDGPPDLDPCSNPYSRVCAKTEFTLEKGNDGLIDEWSARNIFVNPPFGKGWWKPNAAGRRDYIWPSERKAKKAELSKTDFNAWIKPYKLADIGDWIKRCADYGEGDRNVVGLIPSYTGVKAWQRHVWKRASAVFFPEGRIHFRLVYLQPDGSAIEKSGPAPMDCAMPLWTHDHAIVDRFCKVFDEHGHVQLI